MSTSSIRPGFVDQEAAACQRRLVASTLDISNTNVMAGRTTFSGASSASVVNKGGLTARQGRLCRPARQDRVQSGRHPPRRLEPWPCPPARRSRSNFNGDLLVDVTIDQGVLNALVENRQLIKANGGRVIMTARAANAVLSAQVNNSGIVQARTMAALTGRTDQKSAKGRSRSTPRRTTAVSGKLDASAPKGGNGGIVETRGTRQDRSGATITTKAASETSGSSAIDPDGFTIGANGDVTGAALTARSPTETSPSPPPPVQARAGTSTSTALTAGPRIADLNATNNIYVNTVMTATGTANFVANYGHVLDASGSQPLTRAISATERSHSPTARRSGSTPTTRRWGSIRRRTHLSSYSFGPGTYSGQIDISGSGSVTLNGAAYTVIADATGLAAASTDLSGHYALGADLSAPANSLTPIGSAAAPFTGAFDGLATRSAQRNRSGLGPLRRRRLGRRCRQSVSLQPHSAQSQQSGTRHHRSDRQHDRDRRHRRRQPGQRRQHHREREHHHSEPIFRPAGLGDRRRRLRRREITGRSRTATPRSRPRARSTSEASSETTKPAAPSTTARPVSPRPTSTGHRVQSSMPGGFAGMNSGTIAQSYVRSGVELSGDAVGPSANSLGAGFVGKNTSPA